MRNWGVSATARLCHRACDYREPQWAGRRCRVYGSPTGCPDCEAALWTAERIPGNDRVTMPGTNFSVNLAQCGRDGCQAARFRIAFSLIQPNWFGSSPAVFSTCCRVLSPARRDHPSRPDRQRKRSPVCPFSSHMPMACRSPRFHQTIYALYQRQDRASYSDCPARVGICLPRLSTAHFGAATYLLYIQLRSILPDLAGFKKTRSRSDLSKRPV